MEAVSVGLINLIEPIAEHVEENEKFITKKKRKVTIGRCDVYLVFMTLYKNYGKIMDEFALKSPKIDF